MQYDRREEKDPQETLRELAAEYATILNLLPDDDDIMLARHYLAKSIAHTKRFLQRKYETD